jgi:carbon monoxide dehydrogenase subunit G
MEIEGTYTLQAPAEEVWRCLMDQQIIKQTIPGLERLARNDEQEYSFAMQVRHAPLRGAYTGHATMQEQHYPTSYTLNIEGEGQSHQFQCECAIRLLTQNANTVISYHGSIQWNRSNRLISTPLIKGALKVLLQQFFTALADQLRSEREALIYVTTLEESYDMPFMEEQLSEHLHTNAQYNQGSWLHKMVRFLGLGQRDPQQEELWVRRLRQIGIAVALLFLVWIGTRLPRRPSTRS